MVDAGDETIFPTALHVSGCAALAGDRDAVAIFAVTAVVPTRPAQRTAKSGAALELSPVTAKNVASDVHATTNRQACAFTVSRL